MKEYIKLHILLVIFLFNEFMFIQKRYPRLPDGDPRYPMGTGMGM